MIIFISMISIFAANMSFRKEYSTEVPVLELIDRITQHLDKGTTSGTTHINVYIDLSKAFDTVDHNILLHKGAPGNAAEKGVSAPIETCSVIASGAI